MSAAANPHPSAGDPADPVQPPDPCARWMAMLDRLAEQGMQIAEVIHAEATAPERTADLHQLATAYGRVARAVRLTILLQSRLSADAWGRPDREWRPRDDVAAKDVEDDLETEHPERITVDWMERETLHGEYREALDEPIEAVAARLGRDLGLGPDVTGPADRAGAKPPRFKLDWGSPRASDLKPNASQPPAQPGRRRSG